MRFLPGLFEGKATDGAGVEPAGDKRSINRVRGGTQSLMSSGGGYDSDKAVRNFYERVMIVFRCVDAIADNASRLPIRIVKPSGGDEEWTEVKMPDLWRLLNRRPNTYETATQFRYRLSSLLLLSRKGVFIEVVPSAAGTPAELHILPLSTEPVKDAKTFVSGFKIRADDNKEDALLLYGTDKAKGKNSVLWIRTKPHPTDPYAQVTPLMSAHLAADTDYFARLWNRNFMQNDGRPGMLIAVRGRLGREDAMELKNYFAGGLMQAGATRVIEADDISVADMSGSPRDAQYLEALKGTKEDLMMAFGVSETFLGQASQKTFDNADAEFEVTWTTTMLGHVGAIDNGLDTLTGDINDDIFVQHDLRKVDVLQRIERRRHDKAMEEFVAGTITWDEYRKTTGKKPWNVPMSRVAFLPTGLVIIENESDIGPVIEFMNKLNGKPPAPALGAGDEPPVEEEDNGTDEGAGGTTGTVRSIESARRLRVAGKILEIASIQRKALTRGTKVIQGEVISSEDETLGSMDSKAHPYDELRGRIEAECGAVLSSWSRRQEKAVLARVSGPGATTHTRHYEGVKAGTKALDASTVVRPTQWAKDIRDDIEDIIEPQARKQIAATMKELDKRGVLSLLGKSGSGDPLKRLTGKAEDTVLKAAMKPVLDMVETSGRRQSERVADVIKQMDANGKSMTEIKAEVKRMIGSRSSWFKGLSTHATTALIEGVQSEVLGYAGKSVVRTWNTESDEKVRPTHWDQEGEEKVGGKPFTVGKSLLMYPGDPDGDVGETANCRCWTTWAPAKSVIMSRPRTQRIETASR